MHSFSTQNSASTPVLTNAALLQQPVLPDQVHRPYSTTWNNNIQAGLENLFSENQAAGGVRSSAIAGLGAQLFQCSDVGHGKVIVPNGWETSRASCIFRFETKTATSRIVEVLLAYSDHYGVSARGNIDPNMAIWFNHYIQIRYNTSYSPDGSRIETPTVCANEELLSDKFLSGAGDLNPQITFNNRVSQTLGALSLLMSNGINHKTDNLSIPNHMNSKGGVMVRSEQVMPGAYMADVINAYTRASMSGSEDSNFSNEFMFGNNESNTYSASRALVNETKISQAPIFNFINNHFDYLSTGMLTMGDILSLWPDSSMNSPYHVFNATGGYPADKRHGKESWGKTTRGGEAKVAYLLSHIVPAAMTRQLMGYVNFTITNRTPYQQPEVIFLDQPRMMYDDIKDDSFFYRLKHILSTDVHETLIGLLGHGADYFISCRCNIYGCCEIDISLNGTPIVEYIAPNFCSSITNPLLSFDGNSTFEIASDIGRAVESVTTMSGNSNVPDYYAGFRNF